ncbi:MAG: hypothetical protein EBZ48_02110 [Proteobacteria bacterium]|nr:hypothetical protein [Pseudomonadota bacterium]
MFGGVRFTKSYGLYWGRIVFTGRLTHVAKERGGFVIRSPNGGVAGAWEPRGNIQIYEQVKGRSRDNQGKNW